MYLQIFHSVWFIEPVNTPWCQDTLYFSLSHSRLFVANTTLRVIIFLILQNMQIYSKHLIMWLTQRLVGGTSVYKEPSAEAESQTTHR